MAIYDPPQPLWKRNVAGVLDFLLASLAFGFLLSKVFGNQPAIPPVITPTGTHTEFFSLDTWPTLLTIALVVAYFVILGRTGGTIFQRLFGMKRAKQAP
jgi:CDP-diglyceride synthetase